MEDLLASTGPSVTQQQELLKKTEELKSASDDLKKVRAASLDMETKLNQLEKERKDERSNLEQTIRQLNFQMNIISNELKTKDAGIYFGI